MEPLTPLISQSDYRVQTSLFMLDSSGLELICDALRLSNVLICDPTDSERSCGADHQQKTREISLSHEKVCLVLTMICVSDLFPWMSPKTHNALRTAGSILDIKQSKRLLILTKIQIRRLHENLIGLCRTELTSQLTWSYCAITLQLARQVENHTVLMKSKHMSRFKGFCIMGGHKWMLACLTLLADEDEVCSQ